MLFSPQILVRNPPKPAVAAGLGLQTNLTGFWSFENTSWTDDTGNGSTLTGTGSPTSVAGLVGNAVSLNGSTQYLQCTSNSNLVTASGSFSFAFWINGATPPNTGWVSKDNNAFGQREWIARTRFTTSNVYSWTAFDSSSTGYNCDSNVSISAGWHFFVGTFNATGLAMKIYIDGTDVTQGTPTVTGAVNSSASAPFNIGFTPSTILSSAALVDQLGFWKGRVLSASDVTALYNSGSGLSYAAMA